MPQSGTWRAERDGGEDNEAGRGEEEKKTPVGPAGQAGPTGGGRTPIDRSFDEGAYRAGSEFDAAVEHDVRPVVVAAGVLGGAVVGHGQGTD